jgi:hypothetical protein
MPTGRPSPEVFRLGDEDSEPDTKQSGKLIWRKDSGALRSTLSHVVAVSDIGLNLTLLSPGAI